MQTDKRIRTDVLIVGAGIAGPALACALRNSGLTTLLIEKSDTPGDTARGDHLQPRSCEILDRWGVLKDLFLSGAEKRSGSRWCDQNGRAIFHSDVSVLDIPHPYFAYLDHEKISATLLQVALREANVEIIRPIRNWWIEDIKEEGTTVRVGLPNGGDVYIDTLALVGADGRNSRVRKAMDIATESHRYERSIGVLFADLDAPFPGNDLHVYLQESRVVPVIPRIGGGCKIGIPLGANEVAAWRRADAAELQRSVRELLPALALSNVRFGDIYPPVYLRTDAWVRGRSVLIGDACHAMHPARSQGMNISIRCIDALSRALMDCGTPLEAGAVAPALAGYEKMLKPAIDEILIANHENGLEMDRSDQGSYEDLRASLAKVDSIPGAGVAHAMQAAGY